MSKPVNINVPAGAYGPAIEEFKRIMGDESLDPSQRAQAVIDLDQRVAAANAQRQRAAEPPPARTLTQRMANVLGSGALRKPR